MRVCASGRPARSVICPRGAGMPTLNRRAAVCVSQVGVMVGSATDSWPKECEEMLKVIVTKRRRYFKARRFRGFRGGWTFRTWTTKINPALISDFLRIGPGPKSDLRFHPLCFVICKKLFVLRRSQAVVGLPSHSQIAGHSIAKQHKRKVLASA